MGMERSIWVIGDIHGMVDPLTTLLNTIRCIEYTRDRRVTIVFLGDYIDHGPCSKEVVDYLLGLAEDLDAVFLAGNHEDMLLQFLKPEPGLEDYGLAWFTANGGQATVCSFMRSRYILRRLWMRAAAIDGFTAADFRLEPCHQRFFESLQYAHTEEIPLGLQRVRLAFTHATLYRQADSHLPVDDLDADIPIEQQLISRTRREFAALRRRYPLWMENYHIWNRDPPRTRYGDFVLVHGHTPTPILGSVCPDRLGTYNPECGLPFVLFPEGMDVRVSRDGDNIRFGARLSDVAAINIDTGSVYGTALTALNFSTSRLRTDARVGVVQVHSGATQRDYGGCHSFHLCFDGL